MTDTDTAVSRNIETFLRFQREVIIAGDFTVFDELVSPEAVTLRSANVTLRALEGLPVPGGPTPIRRDGFLRAWQEAMRGRTDQVRTFDEVHGTGDVVFARWTLSWIHDTETHGVPPTGRRVSQTEVGFIRFDDEGRILQGWYLADPLELLSSLGARVTVSAP